MSLHKQEIIRVLFLTGTVPSKFYGGASQQAFALGVNLSKNYDINVIVLATDPWTKVRIEDYAIVNSDVETNAIESVEVRNFWSKLWSSIRVGLEIVRSCDEWDILHCHAVRVNWWLAIVLAKFFLNKKVVLKVSLLGQDDPETLREKGLIHRSPRLLSYTLADRIVCLTDAILFSCQRVGIPPERLIKIPNSVNTDQFQPVCDTRARSLRRDLHLPEDKWIVTFVGRIGFRKGTDILLMTWERFVQNAGNVLLLIIGPNPTHQREQEALQKLFEVKSIRFIGTVPNTAPYLQASNAFVLPSRAEGMPNALLEAMACGLPCISSDIDACRSLIENEKNGLLSSLEDHESLMGQLSLLYNNPKLASNLGINAHKTVIKKYSMHVVTEMYYQLYRELVL